MTENSSTTKNIIMFGLGVTAGWFIKQLFDSPQFAPQKEKITATAQELRTRLMESEPAERVRTIFGSLSDELLSIYVESKEKLVAELSELKVSIDEIDKKKYISIVTAIINELRTENKLSSKQLEALTKALQSDYVIIRQRKVLAATEPED
jgi:hypothetical protein